MHESVLIKNIKYIIAKAWHNSEDGTLSVDTILPLVAAEVYPHRRNITWMGVDLQAKYGTLQVFVDALKGITSYDLYDKESLPVALSQQWMPSLSFRKKKELALSITLIVAVEEDGYISLKGSEKLYATLLAQGYTTTNAQYGNLVIVKEQTNNAMENTKVTDANDTTRSASETPTEKEQDSVACNSMENVCTVSTPIQDFFYRILPPAKYPNGLRTYDYMWQYKLSESQYKELRQLVKPYFAKGDPKKKDLENNILSAYGKENGTLSLVLILLLSEWYRRECKRLDGDQGLQAIGFSRNPSSNIWNTAKLPEWLLHNQEGNRMRQTAMCMLGGFPLQCVIENNQQRFEKLINALYETQSEDDITDSTIEEIANNFDNNNRVFTESLREGSCNAFVKQLALYTLTQEIEQLPFAREDVELKSNKTFLKSIEEGFAAKIRRDFIKGCINVWISPPSLELGADFSLHIGFKNQNNSLSPNALRQLLGHSSFDDKQNFVVTIRINSIDGSTKDTDFLFVRVGNGCRDYVSAGMTEQNITFNIFTTNSIIALIDGKEVYKKKIPGYLELYQTDNPFCWSTEKISKSEKSLLIDIAKYDCEELSFEDKHTDKETVSRAFVWGIQTEKLTLLEIETGNEVIIPYQTNEKYFVDFQNVLKGTLFTPTSNNVLFTSEDGKEELIPLLYGDNYWVKNSKLRLNIKVGMMTADGISTIINDPIHGKYSYKLQFQRAGNRNFEDWTQTNTPPQGLLKIRICPSNPNSTVGACTCTVFFIPNRKPVVRDLDNKCIKFNINGVYAFNPASNEFDTIIQNNIYPDNQVETDCDAVPFVIKGEGGSILLNVFRSFYHQQLLREGHLVTVGGRSKKTEIAICLREYYKLRLINESGVHYSEDIEIPYIDGFESPASHSKPIEHDDISLYFYRKHAASMEGCRKCCKLMDCRKKGQIRIRISETKKDDYSFFQYTDGETFELNKEFSPCPTEMQCDGHTRKGLLVISGAKPAREGIIFQSLKNCTPHHYYCPSYSNSEQPIFAWNWANYLNQYDHVPTGSLLKLYNLAREHKIYFTIFPQFSTLRNNPGEASILLFKLLKQCNYELETSDIIDLTRFARELSFDWLLIPRSVWIKRLRDENVPKEDAIDCINELFLGSPLLQKHRNIPWFAKRIFDDSYFDTDMQYENVFSSLKNKRRTKAREFMTFIETGKDFKNTIHLLNDLESSDSCLNMFREIYSKYKISNTLKTSIS